MMTTKQGEATESDFYSVVRVDLDRLRTEIKKVIPRAGDKMASYHLKDRDQRIASLLKPNSSM
ncbi:hypothetical protein [Pedobacter miscanthi]|nr:hypothetical protein [Pedobacter miscanthi]